MILDTQEENIRPPPHLNEYVSNDQAYNVDFCYGVNVVNAIST